MHLLSGRASDGDEALELAIAHALVRRAGAGAVDDVLRIYRPARPVAVFGRRDTRLPGFPAAADAARAAGFEPLVRATGGRAVAYTDQALVVDLVVHDQASIGGQDARFERYGALMAGVFATFGVDARVGSVPGEYCPGAHSVNARGSVKLVGTAQRMTRTAWLFSSLVVVADDDRLRPVLAEVYRHLDQPFDADSVGSLRSEVPGLTVGEVEAALVAAYTAEEHPTPGALDRATLGLARELVPDHRVDAVDAATRPPVP